MKHLLWGNMVLGAPEAFKSNLHPWLFEHEFFFSFYKLTMFILKNRTSKIDDRFSHTNVPIFLAFRIHDSEPGHSYRLIVSFRFIAYFLSNKQFFDLEEVK